MLYITLDPSMNSTCRTVNYTAISQSLLENNPIEISITYTLVVFTVARWYLIMYMSLRV